MRIPKGLTIEIVNGWKLLTILEKSFIIDVGLGSKYASSVNHNM